MQKPPLTAVRESLVYSQVAGEHNSHVVSSVEHLLCFKRPMEVAGQVKQPCILRSNFGADEADALVAVPVLSTCTSSSHFRLDFHSVVVTSRDPARDAPVPSVSIAALGEDGRVALQGCVLGGTDGSSSHVSRDDEIAHLLRGLAHGDVRQDIVEELEFCASAFIGDNAPILPEDPEFEVPHTRFHNKRGLASRWR